MTTSRAATTKTTPTGKATSAPASQPGFDFSTVTAEKTTIPTKNTTEAPNPLFDHFQRTITEGPLGITIPDDKVKEGTQLIRRAAAKLGLGARIRAVSNGNGTTTIKFASKEKSERKYTNAQVREWAKENHWAPEKWEKTISNDVKDAYRAANGYPAIKRSDT